MFALMSGIVTSFLIPKFLGIEQYSMLKTYTFFANYIPVLQLGIADGMYLKYGGVEYTSIDRRKLKTELVFLTILQAAFSLILLIFSLSINDQAVLLVSVSVVPSNIINVFRLLFQATGRFRQYSRVLLLDSILRVISTVILIFVFQVTIAFFFMISLTLIQCVVALVILANAIDIFSVPRFEKLLSAERFDLIRSGLPIMLGNLSSMLFYSLDRWFVKILLRVEDFAYYSFAVSMMSMILILVESVSATFYPMLSRRYTEISLLRTLKTYLLILGTFAGTAYFGFDLIVNWILTDYLPSLDVIAILFAGFPAIAVIKAIYVNTYKAQKVEKKYFLTVLGMLVASFGLNALAVIINKSNWSIAAATTIAFYFWFFFSSKDFKGTETNPREMAYLLAFLIVFFSTTRLLPWWLGLPLYLASILGITLLFYKKEFMDLSSKIIGAFKIRSLAK